METLKELYTLRDGIQKMNLPISEEFAKEFEEREEKIIKEDILPALSQIIEPQLKEIQRDLVLVVEHHPGEPLRVALSRKANHSEIIREMLNAKPITSTTDTPVPTSHNPMDSTPDTPSAISPNDEDSQERYKNPSKGLRVTFPDGTIIYRYKAIDTFIETLQKIGLERVASLGLECGGGYNIVSRTQRPPTPKCTWQHKVDDWYIYSNISNQAKVSFLQQISDSLRLSLKIELLTEEK